MSTSALQDIKNKAITLIKRDGRKEPFTKAKLKKVCMWASNDDELMTDILLRDTEIKLKDEVRITSMYKNLIDTAVGKVSRLQPKWQFVASKLYLLELYSEAYGIKDKKYPKLQEVLAKGVSAGVYSRELYNSFTLEELAELDKAIQPELDYNFTYHALKQFNAKYCKNYSKTKKLELPQITYMRVAMGLFYNKGEEKIELIKKLYSIITKGQATLATPIMINSFTPLNSFASCILNTIGNNTWDLMNKLTTAGLYTKGRGGVAFDISHIQAKGGMTKNGVQTGGIIPFIQNIQSVVGSMMQAETRRGSAVITCAWWHLEIEDFLQLKDASSGTEENRALHLQYSFASNDLLMKAVENNEDVYLFDPLDVPELLTTYGSEFEEHYNKAITRHGIRRKKVNARELYKTYLKFRFQTGNVYEIMLDNVNNSNMTNRYIGSSNLCVDGETKVLTKNGYIKIKELEGTDVDCWNGEDWSTTKIRKTSDGQEVMSVKLSTQQTIKATPYHKWAVVEQDKWGTVVGECVKRTYELAEGDKLVKFALEPVTHGAVELPLAYENGFYTADGATLPTGILEDKFFVPSSSYSVASRLKWLAGYLDGDGTLTNNNGTESIQAISTDKEFLQSVLLLLQELGVHATISKGVAAGYKPMHKNDGSDALANYWCRETYRLLITGSSLNMLLNLGYTAGRVMPSYRTYNREDRHFIKVEKVYKTGEIIPTYCGEEPKRNKLMFDGVLTMNCSEILEPSRPGELVEELVVTEGKEEHLVTKFKNEEVALCNLASFNCNIYSLGRPVYDDIIYTVSLALDNTIDIGRYMRVGGEYTNMKYRYIGLGYNNYANYMARQRVKLEDEKAEEVTFKLFQGLSNSILRANIRMAAELGTYPAYRESKWQEGVIPYDISNKYLKTKYANFEDYAEYREIKKYLQIYGMRNALTSAVAPTASSATSKDLTESIEPILDYSYELRGTVNATVLVPEFSELNQYYSLAYEVPQEKLILLNAIRQMFIDQSQSFNMYIKEENWNYKYLAKLHILSWKLGMKTQYYLNTPKMDVKDVCDSCSS